MKKVFLSRSAIFMALVMTALSGFSAEVEQSKKPSLDVSAKMELFYEQSDDVSRKGDNDKFKSNEMYLIFDGTFENDLFSRLQLDASDIVSSDGKVVTEKIVEEANFGAKHIGGSPVTLIFGKDEMPFGLDYDKYLNDSIAHQFEIDKVWGFHAIVDIPRVGNVAAAAYQHRHSESDEVDASNETGDNYTARLTIDKLVKNLTVELSGASESYSDTAVTDDATGITTTTGMDDETRWGAGAVYTLKGIGNINAEYIAFNNLKGKPGYDPSLVTLGVQCDLLDNTAIWGRYEIIGEDTTEDVETDFWAVGVKYAAAKNFDLLLEYANFNSGNMKDAHDLKVDKGSLKNAVLFGVKAKF